MKKIIVALLILCVYLAYEIAKEVLDVTNDAKSWDVKVLEKSECDLQDGPCSFEFAGNKYELEVPSRPIMINKKHQLMLSGEFSTIQEAWVDFKGVEIDMGYNRLKLKSQGNLYLGDMYLPSCDLEIMTWRTLVILKHNDKLFGFVYKIKTNKNHEN